MRKPRKRLPAHQQMHLDECGGSDFATEELDVYCELHGNVVSKARVPIRIPSKVTQIGSICEISNEIVFEIRWFS